jgi:hypothetical protein
MAADLDLVELSLKINAKLPPQLEKAVERNVVLRIGWTSSGDQVPKNGELGLCPNLPLKSKVRSLGVLGSFVAAFGKGGTYTHQGEIGSFFGAGNDGNTLSCERNAADYTGFRMSSGRITILDGVGNNAGSMIKGGTIVIRGDAGSRIGSGMEGGLIVVHGDVGPDPGTGMSGGRIIINGRCPSPPPGVALRPLKASEVKEINSALKDKDLQIPPDAVCLVCDGEKADFLSRTCSADFSAIAIVSNRNEHRLHGTTDTITIIGERGGQGDALALPIPMLPLLDSGKNVKILHPCLVKSEPRNIDVLLLDSENMAMAGEWLAIAAGFAIDLSTIPPLNAEAMEGLLVALRSMCGLAAPFALIHNLSHTEFLHQTAKLHGADAAISILDDGTGIPAAAALPIIGRSAAATLDGTDCSAAIILPWSANHDDLAIVSASGMGFAISKPKDDLEQWISSLEAGLANHLSRAGLASIDELSRSNLRANDYDTAAISGIRLTGYDRPLPHWFAR